MSKIAWHFKMNSSASALLPLQGEGELIFGSLGVDTYGVDKVDGTLLQVQQRE
jgi:hypothetical protein